MNGCRREVLGRLERIFPKEALRNGEFLVFTAIIIYTFVFSYGSIQKYEAFKAYGFDLGIYNQALWTVLHGMFFYETPDLFWNPGGSFFGVHFAPLMYLILPIYAVYPQPETLLVLQSFILGLGALPLYWLVRHELRSNTLALIVSGMYLLNPGIHAVNLYDFHSEAFLPSFFLFSFYFFLTRRWIKYFLFIALAMVTIDYANLMVIFFGFYWLIRSRGGIVSGLLHLASLILRGDNGTLIVKGREEYGPLLASLATIASGIVIFITAFRVIATYGPEPLISSPLWPHLGTTFNEIVLGLFDPPRIIAALSADYYSKLAYILFLFAPVVFLPILGPIELVMTVPWFTISLLSEQSTFYQFGWQYHANIVPFMLIASLYGIKRLQIAMSRLELIKIVRFLLIMTLFTSVALTPLNPVTRGKIAGGAYENHDIGEHEKLLKKIVELVPSNSSILTQNNIFPHVSSRANAYLWFPPALPDYILFDTKSPEIKHEIGSEASLEIISKTMAQGDYGIVASADGIVLLKCNYTDDPLFFQPFVTVYSYLKLAVKEGTTIADPSSKSGTVLLHRITHLHDSTFWYGPYDSLQLGWYEAVFRLKVSSNDIGYILTLDIASQLGKEILATKRVYGHDFPQPQVWMNISLPFYVKQPQIMEFRGVNVSNSTDIYLDFIEARQLSKALKEKPQPLYFDFKELALKSGSIKDNLMVHSPNDPSGTFWYGPYITLQPSTYAATFWLKTPATPSDLLLTLDVATDLGTRVLTSMNVTGRDLLYEGRWQPLTLTFQLNQTTPNIEFRGIVLASRSEIILSNIELCEAKQVKGE